MNKPNENQSQPQEWTAERIQKIARNNPTLWPEVMARELNKLNEALAAERERNKTLVELFDLLLTREPRLPDDVIALIRGNVDELAKAKEIRKHVKKVLD